MATKEIGILVEFNYEELEVSAPILNKLLNISRAALTFHRFIQVWYPLLRFKEEGYKVYCIGPEEGKVYQSKKGYPCKADTCIDNVAAEVSHVTHSLSMCV